MVAAAEQVAAPEVVVREPEPEPEPEREQVVEEPAAREVLQLEARPGPAARDRAEPAPAAPRGRAAPAPALAPALVQAAEAAVVDRERSTTGR